jgi:hypothetical protein
MSDGSAALTRDRPARSQIRLPTEHKKSLAKYKADIRYWEAVDTSIQRKLVKAISNGEDTEQLRCELEEHAAADLRPLGAGAN